ncbi:Hint domain-containing protein [Rhodophyticola porphyridii]|uniref:Hint domain-containing protein n=1 Tax=Rhodophyticola porphyridii TaxID=1852017 RepID=UPI0035D0995D
MHSETFTFNGGGDIVDYIDNDDQGLFFNDIGTLDNRIQGTIDGQSVNNGLVNPEYAYEIYDSGGNLVGNMYAITLNNTSLDDVVAFTFDFQPVKGETYTVAPGDTTPRIAYSELYVCFADGTLIDTVDGPRKVEDIKIGDKVMTRDRGPQPIIWTGSRKLSHSHLVLHPKVRPILIEPGALGHGTPNTSLVVSPQHRVYLETRVAKRMIGQSDMLIAAKKLLKFDGVEQYVPDNGVTYRHLLCENHEVIMANGSWAETLFLGKMTQEILTEQQMAEIHSAFPGLADRMQLHPLATIAKENRGRIDRLVARESNRRTRLDDRHA